ncbi:MAG TPA: 5-oxoprolinase subunit PxpA [Thermoanaerobaculia bacterium]|nr:5-oxoprolinase subunit PxpA [Thermoanaerobaculia bacterium]
MSIDLNADVGEGMADADLLPFLTSANVACGLHAGDPNSMDETVALAVAHGVSIGAHPGYADRENFGRLLVEMPAGDVERLVLYQIGALDGFVRARGAVLTHVKPHGALYHAGDEYPDVARAITEAVRRYRSTLILVGKSGSMLTEAGRDAGLPVADEAFADRRYQADGNLVPRGRPGAVLTDPEEAAAQAVSIARDGIALADDGSKVEVHADTICVHGDTAGAPVIARLIRERLRQESIAVAPLSAVKKGPAAVAAPVERHA